MRNTAIGLLLVASVGCASLPPPVVVPQPPPVIQHQSNASVYDEAGAPVTDATCTLALDRDTGEAPYDITPGKNWRQSFNYTEPPAHKGWGATMTCTSPNYVTTSQRYEPLLDGELAFPVMKSWHNWGDESGWLSRNGKSLFAENNPKPWRYKGATEFKLLQLYCNGQDIDPILEQLLDVGARDVRVFGMYDPYIGTFTLARDDLPRYDQCLLGLIHEVANHGMRVQYTVFADAQNVMPDTATQITFFTHISALVANEWNVFGELCNECEKNGVDPSRFTKPDGRVLWSRGSGLGASDPSHNPWDIADYHEARDNEYPRKNECRPYRDDGSSPVVGVPCLQSEPMGAAEVDQPGRRAGAINGDPTQAINDFRQMGANFGLQGTGGLCHTDAGIAGDVMGPVQVQMCRAFFHGLTFAPPESSLWTYKRGDNCGDCAGVGGMWLYQRDLPDQNGTLRTFQRDDGTTGYAVEIRPAAGHVPMPIAGAHVTAEPGPGLVVLGR